MVKTIIKKIFFGIIFQFPKLHKNYLYRRVFGKKINWKNPRDLNEWISWLQLYTDTSTWTNLADKYKVRSYVKHCGLEDILIPCYGIWEHPDQIDLKEIPESFVLKTTHGSGDIMIFSQKPLKFKLNDYKKILNNLKNKQGRNTAEYHYLKIKPQIIIEKLLDSSKQGYPSHSLIDYKIWCFNGVPELCWVVYDRKSTCLKMSLFNLDWENLNDELQPSKHYLLGDDDIPCPKKWEEMKEYAAILSKGFPQVRVDLYEVDGKVYFGELTFSSAGGMMTYFKPSILKRLGEKVKDNIELIQNI